MAPRRDPKGKTNPHKRSDQGECDLDPEQQQPETDLPNGAPTLRALRGIADHPNRRWIVVQPDSSYVPRPGPDGDHIIKPWQVNAVVGARRDRVDEVIEQVRDLERPPSEGDFQAHPRRPALGIGHRCDTVSHTAVPADTRAATNRPGSKGLNGESAVARQDLVGRGSGMSLDGFPSRSLEEGGVSGLCQRKSGSASGGATSAAAACSSSSSGCASAGLSTMPADDATIHTARAVTIRPTRADREEGAVHRMPSPGALDRIDDCIEETERFWMDFDPRGAMPAPLQESNEDEDEMLTGDRDSVPTPPDRDRALSSNGQLRPPSSPGQRHTQGEPAPRMDDANGHAAGVEHTQPRPGSPTPSELSIVETVFHVRRPTPPPRRPGVPSLPSSQRHAVTTAGPTSGVRRGSVYRDSEVEQELTVPAVLVPGGGRGRLVLGGSRPPRQVSRRQGRVDGGEEQERRRRKRREE